MNDLSERQKKILWIVAREYIDNAQPIGSEHIICRYANIDCSSATIRKELSELEKTGFLAHPHTSAGRIPTDKGYRFYIDNLMKAYRMTMREKTLVEQLQSSLDDDLQGIVNEAIKTVNSISNYATFVKTDSQLISRITGEVSRTVNTAKKESIFLSGFSRMLLEPEFEDVKKVRNIASLLEKKDTLSDILEAYSDPQKLNVNIGEEMKKEELADYSLVTKSFHRKGEAVGYIGVLGPTRMRYSQVTNTINTIAEMLDDFFDNF